MGHEREHRGGDVQRSDRDVQRSERTHESTLGERPRVQALRVGARDDPQEREADRVADAVVRRASAETTHASASSSSEVQRAPLIEPPKHLEGDVHKGQDVHTPIVRRAEAGGGEPSSDAAAAAVKTRGAGEPLDNVTRARIESQLGADLAHVRVHRGPREAQAARSLDARAFTHKNDIWLGAGQSPQDLRLMAHEATHVVQQGAAGGTVRRAPAHGQAAAPAAAMAPETVELAGHASFTPGADVDAWLDAQPHNRGLVPVRYRNLAAGALRVSKHGKSYDIDRQGIALSHPWLDQVAGVLGRAAPMLVLRSDGSQLTGWVGFDAAHGAADFVQKLFARAEAFGLSGFKIPPPAKSPFRFEGGKLVLALENQQVRLGEVLDGAFTLKLGDDRSVDFKGSVVVKVPGLATGSVELTRTPDGLVTGTAKLAVTLNESLKGDVAVSWDGHVLGGVGMVEYTGKKFTGRVMLKLTHPGQEAQPAANAPRTKGTVRNRIAGGYVLSGEGELDFHFTDWLTGRAQVTIDEQGFLTVVGEIKPQAEVVLMEQRPEPYTKPLFKIEARGVYGLPVIGNLFVFANVSAAAEAQVGPAKLRQIEVKGTYSTDPAQLNAFSITGALNFSASAGVRIRGEGGAGIEILSHDIKAGAAIEAFAGVRGYAEARPTLGYRELAAEPGKDKRGEFFLKGELEIAAQPVLVLSGELFIEIDAPWWSPVPDKKWPWPLGSLTYPLGGGVGIKAGIDYVVGSKQWPTIDFQSCDFSADKFMTDVLKKQAPKGAGKAEEKAASWKDGNPPPPAAAPASAAPATKGPAQPRGGRLAAGAPSPELERAKLAAEKSGKSGSKVKSAADPDAPDAKKAYDLALGLHKLTEQIAALPKHEATAEQADELVTRVRRAHPVFTTLKVVDAGDQWIFEYTASNKQKGGQAKKSKAVKHVTGAPGSPIPIRWYKTADMFPQLHLPSADGKSTRKKIKFPDEAKLGDVTLKPRRPKEGDEPIFRRRARGSSTTGPVREALAGWDVMGDKGTTRLSGFQVDHIHELALGGDDEHSNMWPIDAPTNRAANAVYQQWVEFEPKPGKVVAARIVDCEHGTHFKVKANHHANSPRTTSRDAPVNLGDELRP